MEIIFLVTAINQFLAISNHNSTLVFSVSALEKCIACLTALKLLKQIINLNLR